MKRRVLVTGSSGFIGQWLVEELVRREYTVFGLDVRRPRELPAAVTFLEADILSPEGLARAFDDSRPDFVVHLAARTDLDETVTMEGYAANTTGVRNVLEAVRRAGTVRRVIVTSTQLVNRLGQQPDRTDDYSADTLYGRSKVETEKITRELDGGGAEWCLVRPTTVWGPRMIPHYQNLLRLIQRGLYFHVGRRELRKSYAYVGNIAWQYAQLLAAERNAVHRQTLYLADYAPLTLRAYADALAAELGARKIPTLPVPVARVLAAVGDLMLWVGISYVPLNSRRLRNILTVFEYDLSQTEAACGKPLPFTFEEGVKATVAWWKAARARRLGAP